MTNFNEKFNVNDLKEKLAEVQETNTEFPEIPVGKYEVAIDKITLKENKNKNPMCSIQFKIVDGEYEGKYLFYNQTLVASDKETGQLNVFGLHINNEFLRKLDTGVEIKFDNFDQYGAMLEKVAFEARKLTYLIEYSKNNDFPVYKIKEIYED